MRRAEARPLRVLVVEDSENDALLLLRELRRGGFEPLHRRVSTPEEMEEALEEARSRGEPWQVVVSDYHMPRFGALAALEVLRGLGHDTPFVVVSGKIGEDAVVAMMRAGAQDYVTKEDMARLCPTIERELREVEGRRERARAEEALRFLSEASAELSSSLDYRATLASVARLAVPRLADWCAVDVLEEDGTTRRLAVEHQDPAKVALALELQERYPPEAGDALTNVLRTGRPEFYPEVTDEMVEAAARDAEHLRVLREIGFTSAIVVPMVARGKTLGALTLVSAESGRRYGEADLGVAEGVARRAALAVDNSRLYDAAQRELSWRKRAQEELREFGEQLEIILRGVADGITAQNPSGELIYANEAAARLVGFPTAEALLEAPVREVMRRFEISDEMGKPVPLEGLPGRKALGGEAAEALLRFRETATGTERWAVIGATPVFGEDGRVRFAVNIFRDVTEGRRAEEVLRQSEERYRTFIEQSTEGIWRFELEEAIPVDLPVVEQIEHFYRHSYLAECNDAMARMYGFERATEIVGARLEDMLPREIPENVAYLEAFIRAGYRMTDAESSEVDREGQTKHFLNNLTGIVEDGLLVRAWGTQQDITEQKRAEEALKEGNALLRSVLEGADGPIFVKDQEGRYLLANSSAAEVMGRPAGQILGTSDADIFPPAVAGTLMEADRRVMESGETVTLEEGVPSGNEVRTFLSTKAPYRDHRGEVVGVIGVATDITGRKRIEEALRHSEDLYRSVVEQATENIFLVDTGGMRIVEANAALGRSLGYSLEELRRMSLYDIVAHDRESVDLNVGRVVAEGSRFIGERRYRRKDGTLADVEVGVSAVPYRGRQVMCVVAHDVTERKKSEAALREVREAERNRIARDLHDDILQDIVYALQEIQIAQITADDGGAPELEEAAEALRRSVEGLRGAIFELRLKEALDRSIVSSLQLLLDLNRRMARKEYELRLVVDDTFPRTLPEGTSRELVRIVQEALANVRRHARPQHVLVRLWREGDVAGVEVADDGRGFDVGAPGVGMGQQTMRHRARALGGELRVESAPGSGARVLFEIPLSRLFGKVEARPGDGGAPTA